MSRTDQSPYFCYTTILKAEITFARSVALTVMQPKPISVWEVLIPIIFILKFMQHRQNKELFVQNFIFTKKLALEAVRDMRLKNLTKKEVMARIENHTQEILTQIKSDIYSESIRQNQLKEIDALLEHYLCLFDSDGRDYTTMIQSAYPTKKDYLMFLERLQAVEQKVAAASVQTLSTQADTSMVERIASATAALRTKAAERFYPHA